MNIKGEINRKDLLMMQAYIAFRLKANWYLIAIMLLIVGFSSFALIKSTNVFAWAFSSLIITLIIFVLLTVIASLIQAFFATIEKGYIGPHAYEINKAGFSETTAGTETRSQWHGVENVYKSNSYLFIKISSYRIYIIPKRSFSNQQEFDECAILIARYIENA